MALSACWKAPLFALAKSSLQAESDQSFGWTSHACPPCYRQSSRAQKTEVDAKRNVRQGVAERAIRKGLGVFERERKLDLSSSVLQFCMKKGGERIAPSGISDA